MEPDEVRRQIDSMRDAGWGAAFLHSRIGLTTPYLGEEWFAAVEAAIDQCRMNNMKVYLYDEDKWPSGFSGGTIPLMDESYRMQGLFARPVGAPVPPGATALGEPVDGVQVYAWVAQMGQAWFNGTCYTSLMNREAMAAFIKEAYQTYHDRFADDYGTTIIAEFTDEPSVCFPREVPRGLAPYATEVLSRFQAMHGYDAGSRLHLLFMPGEGAETFRLHYYRTCIDLFENNFSRQIGEWCAAHNIALTGHYMCEGDLYRQQNWSVRVMANYRHQQFPGIDHLGRQIRERLSAKQCQAVVNQYGRPRMLSELYGCTGGSLSFEDRKWIASQQMCLGVNLLNPHLSLYTMAGCRKRDYPQNIFYPQSWWEINGVCDDPLSRTCVALSQGCYVAEALVLHPQESVHTLWQLDLGEDCPGDIVAGDVQPTLADVKERIEHLDAGLNAVMDALLGAQRTFDLGDEDLLEHDGEIIEVYGRPMIRLGLMTYPAVILPAMLTMRPATFALLQAFSAQGGPVLRCGEAPTMLDGMQCCELADWLQAVPQVTADTLPEALAAAVSPQVKVTADAQDKQMLWVHLRDLEGGARLVYLTNLSRTRDFAATVNCSGNWRSVQWLNTADGSIQPVEFTGNGDGLSVEVFFDRAKDLLLLLSPDAAEGKTVSLKRPEAAEVIELPADAWQVERLDDNALTLDYAWWKEGEGEWSARPLPVMAVQRRLDHLGYDGPLTLRYPVRVESLDTQRTMHLVVEYPERYRISVNGTEVCYTGLPFYRDFRWLPIDITGLLHEGDNVIEMHCPFFQHGDLTSVHDAFARYGTEIESIYLVGDFSVSAQANDEKPYQWLWDEFGLEKIPVVCLEKDSLAVTNPYALQYGDVTVQGLGFYPGRLRLSAPLPALSSEADRIFLEVSQLVCPVAEVAVDGIVVGHLHDHPLRVDLTDAVQAGGRRVEITLYASLRNLLGPHHHVHGELVSCGPPSFWPSPAPGTDLAEWTVQWANGTTDSPDWRDHYCMVTFGDLGAIRLVRA